ncbi:ARF GAP with effector function(s) [Thecaphora frezii]
MSYGRPAQSKAQNEANAKILRTLVKHPDNKVCADCKRNDPRWASWNIGCFLCIRCSGIHRSMGTHISKVKSIDLDIWTPEQMESIQKWGNKRCNLYWEAHLKSGHAPPEHKVESFIRSKYESRRWAKDGPPPQDPATLDPESAPAAAPKPPAAEPVRQPAAASRSTAVDLLSEASPAPPVASTGRASLLDDPPVAKSSKPVVVTAASAQQAAALAAPKASGGGGGIFDLDWHDPAGATSPTSPNATGAGGAPKAKNDIMSLFAAKPAAASPAVGGSSGFGDFGSFASPASPVATSTAGNAASSGFGGLNSSFGGLDLNASSAAAASPWAQAAPSANVASSTGGNGLFDTQDVWGSSGGGSSSSATTQQQQPAKNDAFADIWGDFK